MIHSKKPLATWSLILLAVLSSSCASVSFHATPLPAFYKAANETPWTGTTKVFAGNSVDANALPSLAPYVVLEVTGDVSRQTLVQSVWRKAQQLKADVALFYDGGARYTGSVSSYIGYGISVSSPVYARTASVVFFRLCPASLKFLTLWDNIVVFIDPQAKRSAGGLLEGDRVLSVDGVPFDPRRESSYWNARLDLMPGDEIEVIWVREGVGRMSGILECASNPPSHLKLKGSFGSDEWSQ